MCRSAGHQGLGPEHRAPGGHHLAGGAGLLQPGLGGPRSAGQGSSAVIRGMTAIKAGWARKDYGRDRYDVEVSLDDLPDILIKHKVDPAYADIPYSRKLTILRLVAETHATDVYARREMAKHPGWNGKGTPPVAVADVLGRLWTNSRASWPRSWLTTSRLRSR